ncbi:sugar ABC transporter substrate-binding protein [Vagococcus bubulae]|uniref:Sugar ABC transporter substrate-binding protein n=2 Tax=Vagococcus bubulae TaxID=1977868 RepID=A0A429ZQE8_9ENTE|nr:sugar ABC transporter substrate-binding protein [Vagococcus bubulae]
MKHVKKFLFASTAIMATLALTACGGDKKADDKKSSGKDGDVTTLLMYQIGDKPENYDELMSIANKQIEEAINVKVDLQYIGWGDWDKKMSTIIASGENYDISFASNYVANAQKGAYADLTELAPKYAKDAYDQLDEAYIKGNTIDGKLYAFPVNGNVYGQQVLTFNKQYLDKYNLNIDDVNSYADAEKVLKEFHEKEPNIAPFAIGQSFQLSGDYDYPLGKEYPFAVKNDSKDGIKIINQYDDPEFVSNLELMHKWYEDKLIPTDASTNTTGYPLEGNTWFMREETQGPMDYGDTILSNAAGHPLVSKAITKPLKTTAQAQMANFVVSNVSKNKEKSVEFLGLLNSDPTLLNGLVWGVEGEAWEKVGDNRIKLLDGYKPNMHMAAWNTGNNMILYTQDTLPEEKIKERDESIKNAEVSPILGFNFNTAPVKTEITNIANVMNRYKASLNTGTVDPKETLPKLNKDLETAGWDKVQKEMQSQLDDFLKTNK